MSEQQQSINDTLSIIRKALEEEESLPLEINDNVLILIKLVKEDGTLEIVDEKHLNNNEVKEILSQKVSEAFDKYFEKWLDNNIPNYLDKYFKKIK